MTSEQPLSQQPALLTVVQAAHLLGIGRTLAYQLVRTNQWPTPVFRAGRLIRIPSAPLLALMTTGPKETARRRRNHNESDTEPTLAVGVAISNYNLADRLDTAAVLLMKAKTLRSSKHTSIKPRE